MTLEPYTPERLDELALRVFDLSGLLRKMSITMRTEAVASLVVHDRKALEWIAKLEAWSQKTEASLEVAARRARGARRAAEFGSPAANK